MTDKLELKSRHEVIDTVDVANIESIFFCKPDDPDFLTVLTKDGKRLYCDEVYPVDSLQEESVSEDLVEEIDDYIKRNGYDGLDSKEEVKYIANHFVKWQKTKDESCTSDLGEYINELSKQFPEVSFAKLSRIAVRVANWQKENLWKSADGDDLPEKDREVIVICKDSRVTFGHRPFKKFITWHIGYGRTEEHEIETYDKGGWNIPNIKYWLDAELPKEKNYE